MPLDLSPNSLQAVVPSASVTALARSALSDRGAAARPAVRGPFLFVGEGKLLVKAVSYGTFAADENGDLFPPRALVRQDLAAIAAAGFNCIRTYTPPPDWLMVEARAAGLRILVGIYWGGENCDYDEPRVLEVACAAVTAAVRRLRTFPDVVLAFLIGNEVPALVARFHGRRTIERFLRRLYQAGKAEDPEALFSYGNYPTTEFLQLDFLDFLTINVFILDRVKLSAYLDRLLVEAKGKPLVLGEIGDDTLRRGEAAQAQLLDWTVRLAFAKGLAGVNVFSWTDEWVVGGHRVDDWRFGIVDAARRPKASHAVLGRLLAEPVLATRRTAWPRVSVVVCNYNGGATLSETLQSLLRLDYPDYEVVYVDDGSTDDSLAIARRFGDDIRILAQENRGLSAARNAGAELASGSIVAYIDSDAYADPDWLRLLVGALESSGFAAVGGPNLTPDGDGPTAQLIALCPGNPACVLKDNVEADHVAGVNMAFRRDVLLGLGGFDPVHRKAGDDVDICWRLMDAGYRIAYSPTAIVWHHRRPSIRRYLRQQYGYGEAENQLERKHPERFNLGGYIRWGGRVYAAPRSVSVLLKPFVYHGLLGESLFQTLYQKEPSTLLDGPRMVQWYVLWLLLLALAPLSPWCLGLGLLLMASSLASAVFLGITTQEPAALRGVSRARQVAVVSAMYFVHPVVRTAGRIAARLRTGRPTRYLPGLRWLAPGRLVAEARCLLRGPKQSKGCWGVAPQQRMAFVRDVQSEVKRHRIGAMLGREWDNSDLLLQGSFTCQARVFSAPEHFGRGLRVGFKAMLPLAGKSALLAAAALVWAAATVDPRFAAALLVPAAMLAVVLGELGRMRHRLWEAVERVAEKHGAVWYAERNGPRP